MLTHVDRDTAHGPSATAGIFETPADFSIILGGPFFQLLRRAHMTGDALELLRRRVLVIATVAWLPLVLLAAVGGNAFGGDVAVPFLKDIQSHARFIVAMPLLIFAELVVHQRLRAIANEFVVRGLVSADTVDRFQGCVRSAMTLRNSIAAELTMVALIYGVGIPVVWQEFAVHDLGTWYVQATAQGPRFTAAGVWYAYVSVPIFQ